MPMYAFRCAKCEHEFEELVARMGQKAPCPKCGESDEIDRRVTAAAVHAGGSASDLPPCPSGQCAFQGACQMGGRN